MPRGAKGGKALLWAQGPLCQLLGLIVLDVFVWVSVAQLLNSFMKLHPLLQTLFKPKPYTPITPASSSHGLEPLMRI